VIEYKICTNGGFGMKEYKNTKAQTPEENPADNTPKKPQEKEAESKHASASQPGLPINKEKENENLRQELGELTNTLQRLQAEFENYKKRCNKANENFVKLANEELIKELLPAIDNFELALKTHKQKDDFYMGMQLIYSQLITSLESQGVKPIQALGTRFDPYYHEALLAEASDQANNTVLDELQKGYLLHDKVIRHSKVKIAKNLTCDNNNTKDDKKEA
jgi:molecular chaperone GrpE